MTPAEPARQADDRVGAMSDRKRALFAQLQASRAQASGRRADSPVVPLRPGAGPVRLVLLHPSGGALFCYTPLIRALRPDIDVIGVAADPANRDLELDGRMEVVASRTLALLAPLVDPAHCVFAGWSHGGALAFEIARQHAAASGSPPPVVLLDCAYYGDVELEAQDSALRNFVYDLARLAGLEHARVRGALADVDPTAMTLRALLDTAEVTVDLTDAELAGRYETFRSCSLSLGAYRPAGTFPGPVTLLVTEQADEIEAIWREVVTGPFRCVQLPGDHYTLFTPPILPTLVTAIHLAADAMAARRTSP